jgi:hypothetical protein
MKNFMLTVGSILLFNMVFNFNTYAKSEHMSDPDNLSPEEVAKQKGLIDLTDSAPKKGIVFAVCIFTMENGKLKLVDHKEAKNMADCLRAKRTKQREYKNPDKREKVIAGGSKKKFIMKCDKVDAEVEIKEDGTWHIIKILGRNKAAYAKKKAWEK